MSALIQLNHIHKVYDTGAVSVHAVRDVSLNINKGEFVAVMGSSGSGKSTLMNILGCLDRPTEGSYFFGDVDVSKLGRNELAEIRNEKIGFVFQGFNLLSRTSALENVELPMLYGHRTGGRSERERAQDALEKVGLGQRADHHPNQLSGGQQQRFAIVKVAVRALRRNTMRTLLTMLGIIIGVAAVIAMVAIGNGAKARVEAQIASLGQNVILIMSGNTSRGGFRFGFGSPGSLKVEDYDAIKKEVEGLAGISPEVRAQSQVIAGNQNHFPSIRGVGEDYFQIRSWEFASGQNFTETDVRTANKVAVIGQTSSEILFGEGADPVGQIVRIKGAPFTIVGMLAKKGMSMSGSDEDDQIFVPYTSAMKRLTGDTSFRSMNVQAAGPTLVPDVQEQITQVLRQRHRIAGDREDDFLVRTQQEISDTATETSRVMTMLLGSIAGVSLLVGGIGIMNIMLVSVTERTREIGVRMAVGARSWDILLQFLTEAVTLSLVGGLIGIGLGVGGAHIVSAKLGWTTLVSSDSIIVAFAVSAVIGVFFGFYPAQKASQLDPIDALRYE